MPPIENWKKKREKRHSIKYKNRETGSEVHIHSYGDEHESGWAAEARKGRGKKKKAITPKYRTDTAANTENEARRKAKKRAVQWMRKHPNA